MPFRQVSERVVHAGFPITVAVGTFEAPDGSTFERDLVHHPGAVAVIPVHDDGTVTLVRQYRAALDRELWEIPAGLRDVEGEDPARTAHRELAEETGLAAGSMEHLVSFHNSPGFCDELVLIFVARGLSPVPNDLQGIEEAHMVAERFALAEALVMVDDGRITDAKSVIGLCLVARGRA